MSPYNCLYFLIKTTYFCLSSLCKEDDSLLFIKNPTHPFSISLSGNSLFIANTICSYSLFPPPIKIMIFRMPISTVNIIVDFLLLPLLLLTSHPVKSHTKIVLIYLLALTAHFQLTSHFEKLTFMNDDYIFNVILTR